MSSKVLYEKGPFAFTRRGMKYRGDRVATIHQIKSAATDVMEFRELSAWGIGDIAVYAKSIGRESAIDEIAEEISRDRHWVRKCAYVSAAFSEDQREFDLWWTFYYAVYTMPGEVREKLLGLAEKRKWSLDEFKQHLRSLRRSIKEESQSFPEGQYGLIYADPPWEYDNGSVDPTRQIGNHYPTMKLEEIIALTDKDTRTVQDLAAKNCLLYLWATAPKIEEALQVMNAWGFEYRSCMVWDKQVTGMGYWSRVRHELLLIGAKGDVITPDESQRPDSIHSEQRGEHSAKPTYYYEMLESLYPRVPKLELFARSEREGWTLWGNEVAAPPEIPAEAINDDTAVDSDVEQRSRSGKKKGGKAKADKNAPRLVKGSKAAEPAAATA